MGCGQIWLHVDCGNLSTSLGQIWDLGSGVRAVEAGSGIQKNLLNRKQQIASKVSLTNTLASTRWVAGLTVKLAAIASRVIPKSSNRSDLRKHM